MSTQRFDIRHAPAPRESFRLLYISKSKFGGDWNSTTHTHSCTELFYCLSGEGQFYLAGQLFPVKPDDMVIVNPQVEHTELSLNASPLEYIVLGVASMEFLFSKADTNYAIFNCRENRERMVTLLHMLLAEADRSLDGCETVCQDLLEVLLIWLVRCTTISLQLEEAAPTENRECAEIKRYLDTNYREDISLDYDLLIRLDTIFARGKLSVRMGAMEPALSRKHLFFRRARHPLLDPKTAVANDLGLCGFLSFLVATSATQAVNFFVQKNLVFRSNAQFRQAIPKYILLAVVLVLISAALPAYSQAFLLCLGLSQVLVPTAANLMNIVVQVVLSFPTMKFWIMPADKGRVGT